MEDLIILYGGKSGEHEVSLRSAASVYAHLDKERYRITLIGIDVDGRWYLQKEAAFSKDGESLILNKGPAVSVYPSDGLYAGGSKIRTDFVFPVLHGVSGEDGTIQGLLETAGIPYAGSGVLGSAAGMDKAVSKLIWQQKGLPVVPFIEIRSIKDSRIPAAAEKFGFPLFVKPARAGSSVGVRKADNMEEFGRHIEFAFQFDTKIMIEPAVSGREIECSVMGNRIPESFPPGEILLQEGFYDYESKYLESGRARTVVPADLEGKTAEKVREYAEAAFTAVEASGFARVDFFIEKSTGKILLNEINTIPGFTSISMFAKMCGAGGLKYSEVLDRAVMLGKEIYTDRKKLKRIPGDIAARLG